MKKMTNLEKLKFFKNFEFKGKENNMEDTILESLFVKELLNNPACIDLLDVAEKLPNSESINNIKTYLEIHNLSFYNSGVIFNKFKNRMEIFSVYKDLKNKKWVKLVYKNDGEINFTVFDKDDTSSLASLYIF